MTAICIYGQCHCVGFCSVGWLTLDPVCIPLCLYVYNFHNVWAYCSALYAGV